MLHADAVLLVPGDRILHRNSSTGSETQLRFDSYDAPLERIWSVGWPHAPTARLHANRSNFFPVDVTSPSAPPVLGDYLTAETAEVLASETPLYYVGGEDGPCRFDHYEYDPMMDEAEAHQVWAHFPGDPEPSWSRPGDFRLLLPQPTEQSFDAFILALLETPEAV